MFIHHPSAWQPFLHSMQQHSTYTVVVYVSRQNYSVFRFFHQIQPEYYPKTTHTEKQRNTRRAIKPPHNTPLNIQALLNHIKHLLLRLQLSRPWQGSMCHCMDSCCTTILPTQQRRVFYENRYMFND